MEYVGSKNSYEHWSEQWEENVAGLLAYQNTVQAEIDECLQDGDLIGAAAASFDQALAAWEIGDIKEAQAYKMTQASSTMRQTAKLRYAVRSVVAVYSKTP